MQRAPPLLERGLVGAVTITVTLGSLVRVMLRWNKGVILQSTWHARRDSHGGLVRKLLLKPMAKKSSQPQHGRGEGSRAFQTLITAHIFGARGQHVLQLFERASLYAMCDDRLHLVKYHKYNWADKEASS
ncbi:unnamed protein product [Phytophthora fragariaefolia]|uniref:Unnamed protein product n=1 Tax=Phytophthora fragariaefolia TaxID=1490495 RepID=A0A9W7D7M1_9STRA|nr:unnamed protein product [Phytophthora fragariaefolia]